MNQNFKIKNLFHFGMSYIYIKNILVQFWVLRGGGTQALLPRSFQQSFPAGPPGGYPAGPSRGYPGPPFQVLPAVLPSWSFGGGVPSASLERSHGTPVSQSLLLNSDSLFNSIQKEGGPPVHHGKGHMGPSSPSE